MSRVNSQYFIKAAALLLVFKLPFAYADEAPELDGKALFQARCALCHQLPEPGALKAGQWQRIITTMQKRINQAGMVPLTEEQQEKILQYLSSQAKQ